MSLVELTHSEDGAKLTGQATHEDAGNPIDYAAHIPVERTGVYNGVIRISGPAGDAEVAFLQQVVPQRGLSGIDHCGFPVCDCAGCCWAASGMRVRGRAPPKPRWAVRDAFSPDAMADHLKHSVFSYLLTCAFSRAFVILDWLDALHPIFGRSSGQTERSFAYNAQAYLTACGVVDCVYSRRVWK